LALIAGLFSPACGEPPAPVPPPSAPQAPAPPPPKPWPHFEASKTWPTSSDEWFVAQGHYASRYEAQVRVSPEALDAYLALTLNSSMLDGSTLVMWHRTRRSEAPGPIHVMQKQVGGWTFGKLDPEGREAETNTARCQRCHEEASADLLFGPPRPPLVKTETPTE
jgi:hypothetical protein